jgi:transposase-like protein
MSLAIEDQPVVDEKIWRAWLQKGKLREETTARKAKVLTSVVSSRKKKTLQAEVRKHVEAGSAIYTDALKSYEGLNKFQHEVVDHAVEYVNGKVHTNGMENFWSLLKRGVLILLPLLVQSGEVRHGALGRASAARFGSEQSGLHSIFVPVLR